MNWEKYGITTTAKLDSELVQYCLECQYKRREVLDAGKDSGAETRCPTPEAIVSDMNFDFDGSAECDGLYINSWQVADETDSDGPFAARVVTLAGPEATRRIAYSVNEEYVDAVADVSNASQARCDMHRRAYEAFKLHWLGVHGYTIADIFKHADSLGGLEERGFDGELWPCAAEFLENEYRRPELMNGLLSPQDRESWRKEMIGSGVLPESAIVTCDHSDEEHYLDEAFIGLDDVEGARDLVCVCKHRAYDDDCMPLKPTDGLYDVLISTDGYEYSRRVLVNTETDEVTLEGGYF